MKHLVEKAVFGVIAVGLHAAAFTSLPQGGSDSGGAGGAALVSLQGATPRIEAMVATWDRPPQIAQDTAVFRAAPAAEDRSPPAPHPLTPEVSAGARLQSAQPEQPSLAQPPQIERMAALPAAPSPVAPQGPAMPAPEPTNALQFPRPVIANAPLPARQSALHAPPTAAPMPPEPAQPPPDPPTPQARPAPAAAAAAAQPASDGAQPQKAAGTGGSTQAGRNGASDTATLSAGQRSSLISAWGSKIRSRVERRKRFPRGVRTGGRVVLNVTVARTGDLRGVSVSRSSGDPDLDAAAVAAVRRAGRFPEAPKGLAQPVYVFALPVHFDS